MAPYCCDIERFGQARISQRQEIRDRFHLRDQCVFLYAGQLVARKGVDVLLRAYEQLGTLAENSRLWIVGEGELQNELENSIPAEFRSRVDFLGRKSLAELPGIFAAADVFVFPSRHDGWAMVINEACGASLPIIATAQTGAVHDLVEEGVSGFIVESEDSAAFARHMLFFLNNPEARRTFGAASLQLVQKLTPENGAAMLVKELRILCGQPVANPVPS